MLWEKLREYFSFTRKERIGVLVLIFLIIVIFILPNFFPYHVSKEDLESFEQFKNEIAQLKPVSQNDSSFASNDKEDGYDDDHDEVPAKKNKVDEKNHLFYFDPNTISAQDWERLGVKDKTTHTIQHYLSKGGRFNVPQDLKKIYGIQEKDYETLLPFIKINAKPDYDRIGQEEHHEKKSSSSFHSSFEKDRLSIIDINTADSAAFIALPGIGNKLASRIIHFREKLGGFYKIEQIAEVYGVPDSTFQKIKSFLSIENDSIKKIDINSADINTLKEHPYIRWQLAKSIVQYRQEHGLFKTIDDLRRIESIDDKKFDQIKAYIAIEE